MTIVLSHNTAALYHDAPGRPSCPPAFPESTAPLKSGAPTIEELARAKELLISFGIPPHLLKETHILVSQAKNRRNLKGAHFHVYSGLLPTGSLLRIAAGIYVVDARLCALQATSYLSEFELVEYYCQLCSVIEYPFDTDDDYRDAPQRTNREELYRFFKLFPGERGVKQGIRALNYARDRARSPMEIALLMAIVLPKKMGGLGIKSVEMDHRLDVTARARALTRRSHFFLDLFVPGAKLDLEYNGVIHEDDGNDAIDEERRNALDAMGYSVISVTRHSFFNAAAFQRVVAAIIRKCSIRQSRIPYDFQHKQEHLRQFLLRRWL